MVACDITGLTEDKFNLLKHPKKNGLTITHRRIAKNQRVAIEKGNEILFDPIITM